MQRKSYLFKKILMYKASGKLLTESYSVPSSHSYTGPIYSLPIGRRPVMA